MNSTRPYIQSYRVLLIISVICLFAQVPGLDAKPPDQDMDPIIKEKVISELAVLIEDNYVFPEIAEKIADALRKKHAEKAYDTVFTLQEFIQKVTEDLRSVNNDRHLGIVPRRGGIKSGESPEEMYQKMYLKRGPFHNFGFKKADRLLGNVGFLMIDEFFYVDLEGENVGGDTAKAVMMAVSHSSALIIDLRDNFGGREDMALLVLDYFFEEPTHVLTNHYRGREDKQVWTQGEHPGHRLVDVPLYVLTSQHTVSGGEMFAFVLKNRKRATLVGETTRGSAHKTHLFSLQSAAVDAAIPVGTTIDPVTGIDWEGKGVEPDITASSGQALDVAYKKALEDILKSDVDRMARNEIEWAMMEADANLNPVKLDEPSLQGYVGLFDSRMISCVDGVLAYQRENQAKYELAPMSKDLFSFVDKGMFYVRIRFFRDSSGAVDSLIMLYDTGQKREYKKSK